MLCCTALAVAAVNAAESVPYDITFGSFSITQGGWSQQDKNGYPYWGMNGQGGSIGTSDGTANDDYLVSPAITLVGGKTYEVSVTWHYTNSYNTGERTVEIVYGQGEDAAQFTSAGPIEVGAETTTSVQFTVDADGDYQIALHDTSSGSFLDATSVTAFAIAEVEGTGGGDEPAAELPYSVNWVDGSVSDLAGWSAYSVAGETEFVYKAMPEYEVWFGAVCGGTSCEIDDYLISPMLPFEAGKNYKITVTLNYNYAKDIDVMTGTSLDDTGWTSIGKLEDCSQEAVNELVFTATGEQRIALHAVSAAGVGDCQIAAVSIAETDEQPGGGDEPVEALAVPQDWSFAGSAEAGWTVVNGSEYAQSYWYPSDEGMMIQAQVMSSVDSYLVSPYLALEAGQSYEVTVDWHENSTGTHTINLLYGTGDELADFADAGSVDMVAGGSDKVTFTATEAGNYRITLHSSTYTQFDGAGQAWVSAIHIATAQGGGEPTTGLPIPQEWSFSNTLADWTVENLDDSGSTGEWSAGANGVMCSQYDHGTYFTSPYVALEAGKTYEVTAVWHSKTYTYEDTPHVINAVYGSGTDFTAYTEAGNIGVANGGGEYSVKITVNATGDYRIALHNESVGYYGTAYLQSISIAEATEGGGDEPGGETEGLPYTKNFKADNNMDGWTTVDVNGGGTWTVYTDTGVSAYYSSGPYDDWLLSPDLEFKSPGDYQIIVGVDGMTMGSGPDVIDVYTGSGSDVSTYTMQGTLTLETGAQTVIKFSIAEAGTYKVALHDHSAAMATWYVTSVTVDSYTGGGDEPEPGAALLDKDFVENDDLSDWTVINTNGGSEWSTGVADGVALTMSMNGAQDDWLISPAMTLEEGKSYVVSYAISSTGSMAPETMVTAFGTAATAEGMTEIVGEESFMGDEVTKYYRFTPAATGTYYFGFHATSESFGGTIIISRVKVAESTGITPVAPTGLVASPNIQAGTVALNWVNPTIDTENIALAGNMTLRITRNGEQVDEISGEPGEEMSYTDRPEPFEGEATYQVQAYVTADKVGEAAEAIANLDDFQGERKLLEGWGTTRDENYETHEYALFNEWTEQHTGSYSFSNQSWDADGCYPWMISYCNGGGAWIISPAVELSANRRYEITATFQGGYNGSGADFEIYYGTAAQVSAMTNMLYETGMVSLDPSSGLDAWQNFTTDQFAVEEDGTYYFAIQCTSANTTSYARAFLLYYYENTVTGPVDAPYTNDFASGNLSGWSLPAGTTFAVANEALTSTAAGAERNETVYSPLVNMKGGYTYEVAFDYDYSGTGDFTFAMATGQSSTELLTDSITALTGTGRVSYLFTPAEDGSYCAVWQLAAPADDAAEATIDNLAIGANVYAALPYSEDFEGLSINSVPTGFEGMNVVQDGDGNLAAEINAAEGEGLSPWFNYTELRETYTLTMKVKRPGYYGWEVNAVNSEGESLLVGSIEPTTEDWTEVSFQIPVFESEEPYSFRLEFSNMIGEGTLQIDDIAITKNYRAIVPAAPLNFRVYPDGNIALNYPIDDAEGYDLEIGTPITVTIYDGDTQVYVANGAISGLGGVTTVPGAGTVVDVYEQIELSDTWTNDVKLFRAVPSIDGHEGQAATWVLRRHDNERFEYDGNTLKVAEFDFTGDDDWTMDGWTAADGVARATGEGTATLTSPGFEMQAGMVYMVRYYIATDADEAADFTVSVGNNSQSFTSARIGYNTFDWNGYPELRGDFFYIDFLLPEAEAASTGNVTITASNIGREVAVERVEVREVRIYPGEVSVPYENDFDDPAVEPGTFEPNWTVPFYTNYWRIDTVANYGDGLTAVSGTRALIAPPTTELGVSGMPEDFIYTPYVRVEAGKAYMVEFDYLMPSASTGLAFLNADEPTYTEGKFVAVELPQATQWKHQTIDLGTCESTGTTVFGFWAYAAETRDQLIAIDNFRIVETEPVSVSELEAGATVRYFDGKLMIPADVANTTVYDAQGRTVMGTAETGTVSLDGLTDGVYVVKAVKTDGTVETLKIVK